MVAVSRRGRDRLVSAGRAEHPFIVHVIDNHGAEARLEARAVIDASGTWGQPNPAGADGVPAVGERAAAAGVLTYIPPPPGLGYPRGKHVVVVGSGHSAMTAVIELAEVVRRDASTTVTWVLRRGGRGHVRRRGGGRTATARRTGVRSQEAVEAGLVRCDGFRTERVDLVDGRAVLIAEDGASLPAADHVVVLTGFRPDLSFLSEMRIELDPILQAPVKLARRSIRTCTRAAVFCRTAPPNWPTRNPTVHRGHEVLWACTDIPGDDRLRQVRSIAAELAGDHEAPVESS